METRSDAWMLLRKELDNLREHLKQASEEARQAWQANFLKIAQDLAQRQSELDKAKIDDLELAFRVASLPSISSPVPNTNLLPTLSAAVPIDEHRLDNAISEIRRDFDGKLYDLHIILTNDANARNNILNNDLDAREDRKLRNISALITSSIGGNILPNVATVSTGPQISFNLASCQSRAKASQCQVEPELSQSVLNKSQESAQPILPNVATVSTGPHISFKLAACQSRAKASQCQDEPELSQSMLN